MAEYNGGPIFSSLVHKWSIVTDWTPENRIPEILVWINVKSSDLEIGDFVRVCWYVHSVQLC